VTKKDSSPKRPSYHSVLILFPATITRPLPENHSGSIAGALEAHSGSIAGALEVHSGSMAGAPAIHSGSIAGARSDHSGSIAGAALGFTLVGIGFSIYITNPQLYNFNEKVVLLLLKTTLVGPLLPCSLRFCQFFDNWDPGHG
jgi:hypothetical protein